MYEFTMLAMLALALIKVVDFLVDQMAGLERMRSTMTFIGAVGGMYALDFSLFRAWGLEVSSDWMGVAATGFMVAGITVAWRAVFSYVTHQTSPLDESLGDHHPLLERVA